ncbi:C4-dicarboxylate ABC transporter substrate-binding protein [Acuticoccus sediminis]|uniref:C4-dicarboxylate ABC transporter substrate-binding protein n=1 Tax=Acuticoccus sediminis TaxID=2184697 RepID=A0A8B2NJ63_9HYPH|nr:TRAP transporter substrate-binding protein [Acuticoccus sediminis]RAH97270.1 C4-dicarboxylate ABC transporter substrate-binding protein [Acuticoccus sediminis]
MRLFTLAAIAGCALAPVTASAAENLSYAHFMPATSWQQDEMFQAWADAVAEESGGELGVTVYPAQTLGKAPAGYDNARMGVADIAWTVQGYTAGRFPLSQIIELPGLFDTAEVGSCAFQKLYDSGALDAEYEDTHVLFVHTHGPGQLHTRDTPVSKIADLQGLKLRRPTAVIGTLLSELGAEPVGLPAPQIYESLQRGVIDGYMITWESTTSFRLAELSKYHTDFGFYALAFVTTMNKDKYESLSPAAKAAVDANSGMKWSLVAGRGYDKADAEALAEIEESSEVLKISDEELPEWQAAADRATEIYLEELESKGLPGRETYEKVKEYVASCEAELG